MLSFINLRQEWLLVLNDAPARHRYSCDAVWEHQHFLFLNRSKKERFQNGKIRMGYLKIYTVTHTFCFRDYKSMGLLGSLPIEPVMYNVKKKNARMR